LNAILPHPPGTAVAGFSASHLDSFDLPTSPGGVTKPLPAEFKWRQFEPQVILMAVGWCLRFSFSYRDVEELVRERGLTVDHVTVWRWVQRYAPEIDRRLRPHLKSTNKSWRVDETYIRVKGKWTYLYRAVDSASASIDLCSPPGGMQPPPSGSFRRCCVHRTTPRHG
jgi:hypothetical protein